MPLSSSIREKSSTLETYIDPIYKPLNRLLGDYSLRIQQISLRPYASQALRNNLRFDRRQILHVSMLFEELCLMQPEEKESQIKRYYQILCNGLFMMSCIHEFDSFAPPAYHPESQLVLLELDMAVQTSLLQLHLLVDRQDQEYRRSLIYLKELTDENRRKMISVFK